MTTEKRAFNYHRLFRPNNLTEIQGEHNRKEIKFVLNQIENGNTSIVYIFKGPPGTGKTSTCYAMAQLLTCCEPIAPGIPCGTCNACLEAVSQSDTMMDIKIVNAGTVNSAESARSLINTIESRNPFYGKKFIIIIDEWHNLSKAALEAFLGIFEDAKIGSTTEECRYTFLLPTTSVDKIPAALLSRAHILEFQTLTKSELRKYLSSCCDTLEVPYEEEAFDIIFDATQGGVRDALKELERIVFTYDFKVTAEDAKDYFSASKSKLAPLVFESIMNLNTMKCSNIIKKHLYEHKLSERDFNDLYDLFDSYGYSEDAIFDTDLITECLKDLIDASSTFRRTQQHEIFYVCVRTIISKLKLETVDMILKLVDTRSTDFAKRLRNLHPQLKVVGAELTLSLLEPSDKPLSYYEGGFRSNFMQNIFKRFNIKRYEFI